MDTSKQPLLFGSATKAQRSGSLPTSKGRAPQPTPEILAEYLTKNLASLVPTKLMDELVNGYSTEFPQIFYRGDISFLKTPAVSVVGTRQPSELGKARTAKISTLLVEKGFVVLSGLAKGIDTIVHQTVLDRNGKTVAVLGTPLHKIYPAENRKLAEDIATKGLLLSPSLPHEETGKYLFPRRNRLMALLSVATIITEAGPTSGVIHQAAECLRQGRKLILLKSLVENKRLPWVDGFIKSGAKILESAEQLTELLA